MKSDKILGRNFLKDVEGDAINAFLCMVRHNLRKVLSRFWVLLCLLSAQAKKVLGAFLMRIDGPLALQFTRDATSSARKGCLEMTKKSRRKIILKDRFGLRHKNCSSNFYISQVYFAL